MPKTFYFQVPIESKNIELKDDGTLSIRGMASTKDLDRYNDIVEPTAFKDTLPTFMKNPVMLLQHDGNKAIGRFEETTITDDGLEVLGNVLYDEDGCIKKIQDGVLGAFSIGYIPKKYEIRNGDGKLLATEQGYEEGVSWEDVWFDATAVRTIKELDLIEISVVSTPANPHAVFSLSKSIKSFFEEEKKHWKELLEKKETPTDTPAEVDEPLETDNVANEVLGKDETAGETPAAPAEPVSETPDSSETPAEPEEKSLKGDEIQTLRDEVKGLLTQVDEFKTIATKLITICEGLNNDNEELKKVIARIPVKKGMVSIDYTPKKKGYIESLLEEAHGA